MNIWGWIKKLFAQEKKVRREAKLNDNEFFVRQAREQFERLSKRGLGIPIATL